MKELDCSWLREEDFDELTNSMEVSDTTSHSLVYPEIKPMMINLTVYFSIMQWLIVLASVTSWSFRTASSVSRSDAPHAFLSVVSQSPRDLGDWRWWLDSTASLRERREYGAHRIHPDFPIEGSLRRSASTAFCRDWIEWNHGVDSKSISMVHFAYASSAFFVSSAVS